MLKPATVLIATFVGLHPAAAFVDEKTGLAVEPEPPYQATAGAPRPNFDVVVNVKSSSGKPTAAGPDGNICGVAFKLAPQNAGLAQSEINDRITKPDWIATIKEPFKAMGEIERTNTFDQEGAKGVELVVAPKAGPGADAVRMYVALWETPKGRAVVSCAGKVDEMPQALEAFQSIRRSVRAPR
jgi:hypothetical protein